MTGSYALMDTDTLNMVGSFRSRAAALRVVAEAAQKYGETSEEATSLVLFRQDGDPGEAYIAKGKDLVELAVSAARPGKQKRPKIPAPHNRSLFGPLRQEGVQIDPSEWNDIRARAEDAIAADALGRLQGRS
jgi:hypothetical protein